MMHKEIFEEYTKTIQHIISSLSLGLATIWNISSFNSLDLQ